MCYVNKPYTSLEKYKQVDLENSPWAGGISLVRAVALASSPARPPLSLPPRRLPAGPRDSPAAIITRGHGQRRASPGGQPQGAAAAQRASEGGREGKEESEKEGRKEGHHRSVPTWQFQPLLSARLIAVHTLSPWKRKRKKKSTLLPTTHQQLN